MTTKRTAKSRKDVSHRNGPSEVSPGVFVGGWKDALDFAGTKFCVLDERPPDMPSATHIPIFDESRDAPIPSNLDRLATEIRSARDRDEPVLVFCGHGIRRAPLGGAWYLHRTESVTLDEAFDRVSSVRPAVERPRQWTKGWKILEDDSPGPGKSRRSS